MRAWQPTPPPSKRARKAEQTRKRNAAHGISVAAALDWRAPPSKLAAIDGTERQDSAVERIAKRLELQRVAGGKRPGLEHDSEPLRKTRSVSAAPVCVHAEARRIMKRVREEASTASECFHSLAAASSSDDATCLASDAKKAV